MKTRSTFFSLFIVAVLAACASSGGSPAGEPGRFVMAGPINAVAPQLSMRWQYGLSLDIDPNSISEVKFSCEPIPGTTFSAKGADLRRMSNGTLMVEGPVLLLSPATTPWLYENTGTSAQCRAAISRAGKPEAVITAPVSFSAAVKAATLSQLKMAHEFNSPGRK